MTYTKLLLSGSSYGQPIQLNVTASSVAIPIHTATSGTGSLDEIYIYASNSSSVLTNVTICWGSTGSANQITTYIGSQNGRTLICDGMLLNNGLLVSAFASVTGSILLDGFINKIQ